MPARRIRPTALLLITAAALTETTVYRLAAPLTEFKPGIEDSTQQTSFVLDDTSLTT
jgi:hypothetical protein